MNFSSNSGSSQGMIGENRKKIFLLLIIVVLIMLMVVGIMLLLIKKQIAVGTTIQITVNGTQIKDLPEDVVLVEDNVLYFAIKDIAPNIGYEAYNGEYLVQTEATDKCHVLNAKESASFFENENYIYKLDFNNSDQHSYIEYEIEQPIKKVNDKLYVSAEGLSIACNSKINCEGNKVDITTLEQLVLTATTNAQTQALTFSYDQEFENQKSMLKGYSIVIGANGKYGIIDDSNNEKLGMKYDKITYNEYGNYYEITDISGKIGIWTIENDVAIQKISNTYDSIELMDKDKQLYLVSLNGQYGVVNELEEFKLELEYDDIGIAENKFNIKNRFIIYDNLIPVKKDEKWGFVNLEGDIVVPLEYDEVGCDASTLQNKKNIESLVLIPEYGLIVLKKDGMYGLVNWKGEKTVEFALDAIYYYKVSGEEKAYMESEGQQYDVMQLLENSGNVEKYEPENENDIFSDFYNASSELESVQTNDETDVNETTNEVTNTINNDIQ